MEYFFLLLFVVESTQHKNSCIFIMRDVDDLRVENTLKFTAIHSFYPELIYKRMRSVYVHITQCCLRAMVLVGPEKKERHVTRLIYHTYSWGNITFSLYKSVTWVACSSINFIWKYYFCCAAQKPRNTGEAI